MGILMGDRTSFVRVEPLVLQSRPTILVFDLVVASSTFVGILSQAAAIIWKVTSRYPHPHVKESGNCIQESCLCHL